MTTMLLDGSKSSTSNNSSMYIDVDLLSTSKLLPKTEMADKINLYKQYLKERNECNKYRLIFAINTVCSNVLFNRKTEIIDNEGSSATKAYVGDDEYKLVRNTTATHEKVSGSTLTYHCGFDIFNNHMLRSKEFLFVNKFNYFETNGVPTLSSNTIEDFNRDENGNVERLNVDVGTSTYRLSSHMYRTDNIMDFLECYKKQLKEKDGWFGFYNPTWLNSPNLSGNVVVNRLLNNISPCSFIDMYPDRTLFSFVPKYNEKRGRVEENWDYLLTYPYKNDYDKLRDINVTELKNEFVEYTDDGKLSGYNGTDELYDSLVTSVFIGKNYAKEYTNLGKEVITFTPMFKHNLHVGRYINLYCYNISSHTISVENIQIQSVGDSEGFDEDVTFSVLLENIKNFDENDDKNLYFYKQTENGIECDYYFRRYKVLEYNGELPKSNNSKLAFGRNIYGDNIAQLIYSDDIDINGLKDNLGRDLSELYLTVIKRNAGYKEWYENNNYTASTIEYSHCFGKVTSGLYLQDDYKDYNVKYLTNAGGFGPDGYEFEQIGYKKLDNEITKENIIASGDIIGNFVEFSRKNFEETVLSEVYYRFNTAQRETMNEKYQDISVDELINDDYDSIYKGANYSFNTEKNKLNKIDNGTTDGTTIHGNVAPEGYYYKPNFKIQLKDISDTLSEAQTILLNVNKSNSKIIHNTSSYTNFDYWEIVFKSPKKYNFEKGKQVCIYNRNTKETLFATIHIVEKDGVTVHAIFNADDNTVERSMSADEMLIFLEETIPTYAIYSEIRGTFIWREPMKISDSLSGSNLYDAPFANGAIYLQNNINLFLKRQDPENKYGLARPEEKMVKSIGSLSGISVWGKPKTDLRYLLVTDNNETNVC